MNKGIILEKHRHYTIFLASDGTFQKGIVVNKNAIIGEEAEFKPCQKRFFSCSPMMDFSAVSCPPSAEINDISMTKNK